MRWGLYDGPCPNLLRGYKVLIFVPSEFQSGLLQPSDLSSLPDRRRIACPIRMTLYIFLINNFYLLCCICIEFYDFSTWGGCWFVVYIRRFIYRFLDVCPFDYTAVAGIGLQPLCNVGVVCFVTLPLWHVCWCRGLIQISSFFSYLFISRYRFPYWRIIDWIDVLLV